MTTKEKPQVGDVWQHVNGREAYVVNPGGFPPGHVYFTTIDQPGVRFVTDGTMLTRLLYRPGQADAAQAALLECAKIAVAPFAPQDNLTPEQCVTAVRKLRESCDTYVNKAGELLATRSRQLESQAATIKVLQDTHEDQKKTIVGLQSSERMLLASVDTLQAHSKDRAKELGRADARRAELQTKLDAAEKRVGDALAGLKSNVTDVPRGIPPVVELTIREQKALYDAAAAYSATHTGYTAQVALTALYDLVTQMCAKRAVSQPAFTPSEGVAEVNQALDKLTATLVRHGYVQST